MPKMHFLDSFFNPTNVAIVGASRNQSTINYNLVNNLVKAGFSGRIYPVNPNVSDIQGITAYTNLQNIDSSIDLAVSAVSARATLDVVKECVQKRVKGIVLVSGGFSESGEQGGRIQDEIASLLRQAGIRATGPNTLGPINSSNGLIIAAHPVDKLRKGSSCLVFQSGMYEPRLQWMFSEFHLGISKLIDLGNKMDVNEVDVLEYLLDDPDTGVIAIHAESIRGDGRKFLQLLRNTSKTKPIVVLKSGRTTAGSKAAASHTGSIAKESDVVFDAALKQAGVIRAQEIDEFFDFAKVFEFHRTCIPRGNRIALAVVSGGEGVIATDICQQNGFSMAVLSQRTRTKLKAFSPPWEIPLNPFDVGVCFQFHKLHEVFSGFLESILEDANVDCLAVQLPGLSTPFHGEQPSEQLFLEIKEHGKPVAVWRPSLSGAGDELVEKLESNGIPVYSSAERAIRALSALYKYKVMQSLISQETSRGSS